MIDILSYLIGLIPAIISGIAIFYIQRVQKKRDTMDDERTKTREKESYVTLELELATAKLAYASAMAIKRGKPNGEIEEGIAQYEKALNAFERFEREQLSKL
ncbi:MAG: hypothetical protein KH354_04300 [Clostridiales bacterium]|nr:hypothetical protein [Clostridiales bacterium]